MTLEQYLAESMRAGAIDHVLRASVSPAGLVEFYIHPHNRDGLTCSFVTYDAAVVPVGSPTAPAGAAAVTAVPDLKAA